MDLILHDGDKLYQKEKVYEVDYSDVVNYAEKMLGCNLYEYQKKLLIKMCGQDNQDSAELNVFGDDFKIEIVPANIQDNCAMKIKDFNENQQLESEIAIDFTKDELSQFINLLVSVKEKMA